MLGRTLAGTLDGLAPERVLDQTVLRTIPVITFSIYYRIRPIHLDESERAREPDDYLDVDTPSYGLSYRKQRYHARCR